MKKLFESYGKNHFRLIKENSSTGKYEKYINDPDTDSEVDVIVNYTYTPSGLGKREKGTGVPLEPDEPSSVDIHSVVDDMGKEYELSDIDRERIEIEIMDYILGKNLYRDADVEKDL